MTETLIIFFYKQTNVNEMWNKKQMGTYTNEKSMQLNRQDGLKKPGFDWQYSENIKDYKYNVSDITLLCLGNLPNWDSS